MKALFFLCILSLACTYCSKADPDDSLLAQKVWQQMLSEEKQSQFSQPLDAKTLAEHQKNTAFLKELIPPGYPEPYLPYGRLSDSHIDPPLAVKPSLKKDIVELGEKLFFDERLSFSPHHQTFGGISCARCHKSELKFTDGQVTSQGVDGASTPRNSPTIINAAYNSTLTWANPIFPILEMQARIPLFGDDPVEMGLKGKESELLKYLLRQDSDYVRLLQQVFGLNYPADLQNGRIDYNLITSALAAYERSLISFDTRFDRFLQGKAKPGESLTSSEKKGLELFYGFRPLASGETLNCAKCHAGVLLSNSSHYVRDGVYYNRKSFHNTGMYNVDGLGSYPTKNVGFATPAELQEHPELMGQFRVPPLRFVPLTAPYGHDGSLPTLEAVIYHYAAGGQASLGEHGQNPFVDPLVKKGFSIEPEEVNALVSFLQLLQ